jgi:hypothetical protein
VFDGVGGLERLLIFIYSDGSFELAKYGREEMMRNVINKL